MKQNKYLIAIDLDGTLLNEKHEIPLTTLNYLKSLKEKGHYIVLASGRPLSAIIRYHLLLGLDTPIIAYNGAAIVAKDHYFDKFTYHFDRNKCIDIVEALKEHIENVLLETHDEIWMLKEDKNVLKTFFHQGVKTHFGSLKEILDKDPLTFIIKPYVSSYNEAIYKRVRQEKYLDCRFWSFLPFDEVFDIRVSKGHALKHILKYYHLNKSHLIAFGDGDNDLSMLKLAKFGFIMPNTSLSKEETKHIKYALADCNHEGVYQTLLKLEELNLF